MLLLWLFKLLSKIQLLLFGGLIIIALGAVITFAVLVSGQKTDELRTYRAAVVTNGLDCAKIGSDILKKNGSAVDAALAALFCEGIEMPQSAGLGGGFLMTIYIQKDKKAYVLNSRETAPLNSNETMFNGNSSLATRGGLSIAVPAEIRGYLRAHEKFGKLPWKEVIQPTIDLCRKGVYVTKFFEGVMQGKSALLKADPVLSDIYIDKNTGETYKEGGYIKYLRLAKTLEIMTEEPDAVHNGSLTDGLVEELKSVNSIITKKDLVNYEPQWLEPVSVQLPFGRTMHTVGLPGSGLILTYILNILKNKIDYSQPESMTTLQRTLESFKYGYGRRTELGDRNTTEMLQLIQDLMSEEQAQETSDKISDTQTSNNPKDYGANVTLVEDHGTAHISVMASNGDSVSVTSTINLVFGAGIASDSTGIIFNDEMDDFSSPGINNEFGLPPSVANFIQPGKRPVSSMCPTIITDSDGNVELVVGAAGGTKITTSVALIIMKHLWFNMTIKDAVYDKRIHHQLLPMQIELEPEYEKDEDTLEFLRKVGHKYTFEAPNGFAAAVAISNKDGLYATYDRRRQGQISYL